MTEHASEPWRLLDCLTLLRPEDVLLVGVHCPLDELARRELARGDRPPGLAAHQYDLVHGHGDYDLECDTSAASPRERAQRIKEFSRTAPASPPSPASADATWLTAGNR